MAGAAALLAVVEGVAVMVLLAVLVVRTACQCPLRSSVCSSNLTGHDRTPLRIFQPHQRNIPYDSTRRLHRTNHNCLGVYRTPHNNLDQRARGAVAWPIQRS